MKYQNLYRVLLIDVLWFERVTKDIYFRTVGLVWLTLPVFFFFCSLSFAIV